MDQRLAGLLRLLELERIEANIFRGASRDIGSPQVYGGQVLGQALQAAYATVDEGRVAHSLHAYFLRRGDFNAPIVYFVDRSRDGRSFASRRVTAIQHGEQIFHMSASFQTEQPGIEHQSNMPSVPPPESLPSQELVPSSVHAASEKATQLGSFARPFEFRPVEPIREPHPEHALPVQHFWIRAVERLPDDEVVHRSLLAYVSDFYLLYTATLPHASQFQVGRDFMATIDHAMWFHRPLLVDDWFLVSNFSPSASGSRGLAFGSVYSRDGRLAASTAQEGVVRLLEPAS